MIITALLKKDSLFEEKILNSLLEMVPSFNCDETGKKTIFEKQKIKKIIFDEEKKNNLLYEIILTSLRTGKNLFLQENYSMNAFVTKIFLDNNQNNCEESCLIIFDSCVNLNTNKNSVRQGWLKEVIESGFNPKNVLLVGTRHYFFEEIKIMNELGIKSIKIDDLFLNLEGYTDYIMEFGYGKKVFLNVDLSFMDPVFCPEVNLGVPGGVDFRTFLYMLKRLKKMKNLENISIGGLDISKDISENTVNCLAKMITELI